ncbi:hypothetical protein HPB52_009664 [Rhipicephalus sanguineus]|uniref:Uncharacterized protein n=1 Tax=Rhipicephalus sanguineus TaxID=34632 RepID=A0A9D4PK93_RHISA|nr:hypothetical protein HPB52_009664 [Rhipicephalus sanguineus]
MMIPAGALVTEDVTSCGCLPVGERSQQHRRAPREERDFLQPKRLPTEGSDTSSPAPSCTVRCSRRSCPHSTSLREDWEGCSANTQPTIDEGYRLVVSKAVRRRARAMWSAARPVNPAFIGTMFRPPAPGGACRGSQRLSFAAALPSRPGIAVVRVRHNGNIADTDATTRDCLEEFLAITERSGIQGTNLAAITGSLQSFLDGVASFQGDQAERVAYEGGDAAGSGQSHHKQDHPTAGACRQADPVK